MIVWGGLDANNGALGSGSRYRPATDTWTTTTDDHGPSPRYYHTALWSGEAMLIFGGSTGSSVLGDTFSYMPPRTMSLYLKP